MLFLFVASFLHQRKLKVLHRNLSESKCPQVSRTLLSILTDLNSVLVRMVSAGRLISDSYRLFTMFWGIVPRAQVSYNPSPGVYKDLGCGKVVIWCILLIYVFTVTIVWFFPVMLMILSYRDTWGKVVIIFIVCSIHILGYYFFNDIDSTLGKRCAVFAFHIGWDCQVFFNVLSVPFLIIFMVSPITGSIVVVRCHIFSISLPRTSYIFILLYSLKNTLLSVGTDIWITMYVFLL